MMEQLETGNIGIGNTSTLATLNTDRFLITNCDKFGRLSFNRAFGVKEAA